MDKIRLNYPKVLLGAISIFLGCAGQNSISVKENVVSYGNRQTLLHENKLEGIVNLETITVEKHCYALGPVEGLQGEITVYNDEVSVSTVVDGKPWVSNSKETKAIFLLKANQKDWKKSTIAEELNGLDALEDYIRKKLLENDLDVSKAHPFRIETKVPTMDYHIIFKMDNAPHNRKEHKKAKQRFVLQDEEIQIIGFWVDKAREGKLTHPDKRTHLHFVAKDNSTSGHIDNITIPKTATLFLPIYGNSDK
ncbi:hypothetical protein FGF1_29410 [Flavobacteriaceae bacterium GF1]